MKISTTTLFILSIFVASSFSQEAINYLPSAHIKSASLNEISGMTPTGLPGEYWGIVDKKSTKLFRFTMEGSFLQEISIQDVETDDWEAMTSDDNNIWIGNIGGNRRTIHKEIALKAGLIDEEKNLKEFQLIRIGKPTLSQTLIKGNIYTFRYSDNKVRDCEALFLMNNRLYLIEKIHNNNTTKPKLFVINPSDFSTDDRKSLTAEYIGEMEILGSVTDAAYSSERKQLAVITYTGLFFFNVKQESDLLQPSFHRLTGMFGQCEAICYDDDHLVITNEQRQLWRIPFETAMNVNILSRSRPKISLKKVDAKPIIDGKFDDWINSEIISLQPENTESALNLRILWHETGLYLSGQIEHPTKWDGSENSIIRGRLFAVLSSELDASLLTDQTGVIFTYGVHQTKEGLSARTGRIFASKKTVPFIKSIIIPNEHGSIFEIHFDTPETFKEKWHSGSSFRLNIHLITYKNDKETKWFWSNDLKYWNNLFMPNLGGILTLLE